MAKNGEKVARLLDAMLVRTQEARRKFKTPRHAIGRTFIIFN